jgi:hypothetical protein
MRALNLGIRFLCELGLLAGLAAWGALAVSPVVGRVVLAVLAPLLAAAAWGRWVAPKSPQRLADPARWAVELVLFGAAAAGLTAVGHPRWAVALAVPAVLTGAGSRIWGDAPVHRPVAS